MPMMARVPPNALRVISEAARARRLLRIILYLPELLRLGTIALACSGSSRPLPAHPEQRLERCWHRMFPESPHIRAGVRVALLGMKLVAEREGFEPSIRFCRILTFQASAFDHSATAPHSRNAAI